MQMVYTSIIHSGLEAFQYKKGLYFKTGSGA